MTRNESQKGREWRGSWCALGGGSLLVLLSLHALQALKDKRKATCRHVNMSTRMSNIAKKQPCGFLPSKPDLLNEWTRMTPTGDKRRNPRTLGCLIGTLNPGTLTDTPCNMTLYTFNPGIQGPPPGWRAAGRSTAAAHRPAAPPLLPIQVQYTSLDYKQLFQP